MKNKNYKLYCLINIFKVLPAFLLPVFKDENDVLYFQKINNENSNEIQFVEVDDNSFEKFKKFSNIIFLNSTDFIFLGDDLNYKKITEPIIAVQSGKITIFISNTNEMVKYLLSQNFSDTKFNEEVKRFIQKYNI